MALRWYTIVVDCRDAKAQAQWWAEVLGWKKIYESEDEAVIVPQWVTPEVAAHISDDRDAEIERLLAMGATRVNVGQTGDEGWDVLADPEGNEFCVLSSREF
jgi:hypothetical protein